MPLSRIEIEQLAHDRWHAEVEVGGLSARRENVNGRSFDEVMEQIIDVYARFTAPPSKPAVPVPQQEPQAVPEPQDDADRVDLQNRAMALGISVDRRWGMARLREEVGKAEEAADAMRHGITV